MLDAWHSMSSDDRPRNDSPWKRNPTAIPIPCNNAQPNQTNFPSHNSHISSTAMASNRDPFNPRAGRMNSDLDSKNKNKRNKTLAGVGNRTAKSTLTSHSRKKLRVDEARLKPPLAPEGDPVQLDSSSADEIDLFEKRDKPQLNDHSDYTNHAFDLDSDGQRLNAVASTSRVHEDGPSTRAVQKRLGMRSSSSPIEQYEEELRPPFNYIKGRVKGLVKTWEDRDKGGSSTPHINFRKLANNMKSNPRPKNVLDPVATSLTGFRQGARPASAKSSDYSLPLKACYIDTRFSASPLQLVWNPGGGNCSVSYEADGKKVHLVELDASTDIHYVEYTEQRAPSEAYDDMPVVKFILHPASRKRVRGPDPTSVPVEGHYKCITIKLDTSVKTWSPSVYGHFIQWLRTQKVDASQSRNPKQIWEMAERASHQVSDSEVTLLQAEEPVSRSSLGPRTSDTRSQSDVPREIPDIQLADVQAPRRSSRILTVKKPVIHVDPEKVILVYPQGAPGAINVTNGDVNRLQPGEFLNDTLIEFGLKLWHRELESSNPELAKQIHVFSSFFYKKFNNKNIEAGYESVRKWTSKINLFDKKYIIIPINEHLHWYLAIIYMPEHILRPPPPTPIKQTAASRTRSRTSLAAKAAAEIGIPPESPPAPAPAAGEVDELVSVTDTTNGMDVSPDNSTLNPPTASHPVDDFAMDVDKSEEIAVQEQLQLISPTVSELGVDHAQSSGGRPATEHMDIEIELADEQTDVVPSRYFNKRPETIVITLDSQGQQITTTPITEPKPNEEEEDDQEEDDAEGADDGPNPSQKTYIFTLDSLGTNHPHVAKRLNTYLKMEAQDKRKITNTSNTLNKTAPVPTQPNYCDCGVYLLHFAQTFMTDPAKYFKFINEKKKPPIQERQEIWQHHKIGTMRQELGDRIKELSREWKKARNEAKKDQTDPEESDSSDIEYVDLTPASPTPGKKGKTGKGGTTKKPRPSRLRG